MLVSVSVKVKEEEEEKAFLVLCMSPCSSVGEGPLHPLSGPLSALSTQHPAPSTQHPAPSTQPSAVSETDGSLAWRAKKLGPPGLVVDSCARESGRSDGVTKR